MSEHNKCPHCGTDMREGAKFCDSCGKPVAEDAVAEAPSAAPAAAPKVNWTGVLLVVALVVVVGWLLFGPKGSDKTGNGIDMSNPHGTSMSGSTSSSSANPHGEQAGMEGLMASLGTAKAKLEEDPLDRDALMTLYQNYGMIGRQAQVRPYLDNAVVAMESQAAELGDGLVETGMNIGLAALLGNDLDGARSVYLKLNELKPSQPEVVAMLADVSAAMDEFEEAVKYYVEFLAAATDKDSDQYWGSVINRAVALRMRYQKAAPGEANQQWLDDSIAGLEHAALANQENFSAIFNLGVSYGTAGQKEKAIATLNQARNVAADDMERWQVEAEIAKLNGTEPPPQPEMGSMDMSGMGGMSNPHGGADMGGMGSAEGMPNPHGGMDMGGGEGEMSNPHGG